MNDAEKILQKLKNPYPDPHNAHIWDMAIADAMRAINDAASVQHEPEIDEPVKIGDFDLEVCINAEGSKLAYLGKNGSDVAYRIAGPKAWGGSSTLAKLKISADDFVMFMKDFAPEVARSALKVKS